MSDTQQLFALAAVWTVISIFIARLASNWPGRVALLALLVGIPFWELPYGYYNFAKLCAEVGGLHLYESIRPQKVICAEYPFEDSAKSLLRFGFEGVEAKAKSGEIARFHRQSSETEPNISSGKLTSEYCVTFQNNKMLEWNLVRHDFLITRAATGSVVGRHSVFDWFGTWWQMAAFPFLGRGGACREDPIRPIMSALLNGAQK